MSEHTSLPSRIPGKKVSASPSLPSVRDSATAIPALDGSRLTPNAVLALQRVVGNRAVQRILQRSPNQPAKPSTKRSDKPDARLPGSVVIQHRNAPPLIQMVRLTGTQIVNALKNVDFVRTKLEGTLDRRTDAMEVHLNKALAQYETAFAGKHTNRFNHAVMLSMAIQAAARVIAEELHDTTITSLLAKKLFEIYLPEIRAELKAADMGHRDRVVELTKALVSDDPVTQFMHGTMRLEMAARRLIDMATAARITPVKMFSLLRQRFEAEMSAYTQAEVKQTQDDVRSYSIRHTSGEVSEEFFRSLFGDEDPKFSKNRRQEVTGVQLLDSARNKLDTLKTAVVNGETDWNKGNHVADNDAVGLTAKQKQHLQEIEEADDALDESDIEKQLVRYLVTNLLMTKTQAQAALTTMKNNIGSLPLTITIIGSDWFGKGTKDAPQPPTGANTKFKPATAWTQKKSLDDIFGKGGTDEIEFLGEYTHPKHAQERTANYLRFRQWKDNLMTSLLEFAPQEMPTFGALNPNWDINRSSKSDRAEDYGVNYYGNVHFKIKTANVRDRIVYTAGDHGKPHRDPFLALYDFALGDPYTGLKKKAEFNKVQVVAHILNALTNRNSYMADLPFEFQVFGSVDITRDVEKIYVAGSSDNMELLKANLDAFKRATGVDYEIMDKPDNAAPLKIGSAALADLKMSAFTQRGGNANTLDQNNIGMREFQLMADHFMKLANDLQSASDLDLLLTMFKPLASRYKGMHRPTMSKEDVLVYDRLYTQCVQVLFALRNRSNQWEAALKGAALPM